MCADAVGYREWIETPAIAVSSTGVLLVGTFKGLMVSAGSVCGFESARAIEERYAIDVLSSHGVEYVLTSNGLAQGVYDVRGWRSLDGGGSWQPLPASPPPSFLGSAIVARGDSIWLAGGDHQGSVVMRSDDGGGSWTGDTLVARDLSPSDIAVDPADAERLYVLAHRIADDARVVESTLLVGGSAVGWSEVLTTEEISEMSVSPDGSRLAIAGPTIGVQVARREELAFEQVNARGARCATWARDDRLLVCFDDAREGLLGESFDEGRTLAPLLELTDICQPESCPRETLVGSTCTGQSPDWGARNPSICSAGPMQAVLVTGCGCIQGPAPSRPLGLAALVLVVLWRRRQVVRVRAGRGRPDSSARRQAGLREPAPVSSIVERNTLRCLGRGTPR